MMAKTLEEEHNPTTTQQLERRIRELSTLHEIARAVTSVLDLESVLNRIVEASVYLTNAEEGFLLLVDEETGDLTLRAGKGLGEKAARGMSIKVTDTIAGQVVKTGRPVRMGGLRRDEEYKVKTGYLVKSMVNVPIKSASRVIGVLAADHSIASMRTFSDHDVALLSSLADYAAIAIQNAHLYAEASGKANDLAKALEEQTGTTPALPSAEQDRRVLEQFVQGLRSQREEVLHSIEGARNLAHDLRTQAESAEEVAQRLGLWNEEVLGLLPQLEWLAQAGLPRVAQSPALTAETRPITEASTPPTGIISASQLLEHLSEGALLCDAKGFIRQANQAAAEILDKPVAELVDSDLQTITDDPRWERMIGSLRLALALGNGGGEHTPPAPEATLYISDHAIHARLIPIYQGQFEAAGIIAIFHNISAETEGWRARNEALAALSQKLRGPMTAIASYSDLLLGATVGVVDSIQRRYLQRIQQGVERIEAVLSELGEEPVPSGRRVTPVPSPPIAEVINQAADTAQKVLSLDGVSIIRDIGDDLPRVQIDAEYVSRILADLLTAVGKRTGVGGSVSLSTQVQFDGGRRGHLVVLIQDSGTTSPDGAPLEEDENIRAASSLAEDEGARIWTERKEDGSNLISLLLPVAEPVLPDHML
jgi:GAF domain-containing protein/signal transduction histidine kinase